MTITEKRGKVQQLLFDVMTGEVGYSKATDEVMALFDTKKNIDVDDDVTEMLQKLELIVRKSEVATTAVKLIIIAYEQR